MTQTASINMRIDSQTKQQASKVLDKLHLSMSDAIAIYLRQIVYHQGIPFDLKIPNKITAAAIDQAMYAPVLPALCPRRPGVSQQTRNCAHLATLQDGVQPEHGR